MVRLAATCSSQQPTLGGVIMSQPCLPAVQAAGVLCDSYSSMCDEEVIREKMAM